MPALKPITDDEDTILSGKEFQQHELEKNFHDDHTEHVV